MIGMYTTYVKDRAVSNSQASLSVGSTLRAAGCVLIEFIGELSPVPDNLSQLFFADSCWACLEVVWPINDCDTRAENE